MHWESLAWQHHTPVGWWMTPESDDDGWPPSLCLNAGHCAHSNRLFSPCTCGLCWLAEKHPEKDTARRLVRTAIRWAEKPSHFHLQVHVHVLLCCTGGHTNTHTCTNKQTYVAVVHNSCYRIQVMVCTMIVTAHTCYVNLRSLMNIISARNPQQPATPVSIKGKELVTMIL